jgi:hypothetical protein
MGRRVAARSIGVGAIVVDETLIALAEQGVAVRRRGAILVARADARFRGRACIFRIVAGSVRGRRTAGARDLAPTGAEPCRAAARRDSAGAGGELNRSIAGRHEEQGPGESQSTRGGPGRSAATRRHGASRSMARASSRATPAG